MLRTVSVGTDTGPRRNGSSPRLIASAGLTPGVESGKGGLDGVVQARRAVHHGPDYAGHLPVHDRSQVV